MAQKPKKNKIINELVLLPSDGRPIKYEVNGDSEVRYRLLDTTINQYGPATTLTTKECVDLINFLYKHNKKKEPSEPQQPVSDSSVKQIYLLQQEIDELKSTIKTLKRRL